MEELLGRPGTVNLFWVKVDRSQSAPEVIAAIDGMFANSAHETATETEVALIKSQVVGNLGLMVQGSKFLAAIVMFTIALVAANTAAMAVRERRHEIAVMRAIGFTRNSIISRIVVEGLIVGVTGGALGCGLAYMGFELLPYVAGALGPLALALFSVTANHGLQLHDRGADRRGKRLHPRNPGHPRRHRNRTPRHLNLALLDSDQQARSMAFLGIEGVLPELIC